MKSGIGLLAAMAFAMGGGMGYGTGRTELRESPNRSSKTLPCPALTVSRKDLPKGHQISLEEFMFVVKGKANDYKVVVNAEVNYSNAKGFVKAKTKLEKQIAEFLNYHDIHSLEKYPEFNLVEPIFKENEI